MTNKTAAEKALADVLRWIDNSEHYGHRAWCDAVCGPEGENWYEHDKCNCGRNKLLSDLSTSAQPQAAEPKRDMNGLQSAIEFVQNRRDVFIKAHGYVDPDTGFLEYGRGKHAQLKEEYVSELDEILEGLRALHTFEAAQAPEGEAPCWLNGGCCTDPAYCVDPGDEPGGLCAKNDTRAITPKAEPQDLLDALKEHPEWQLMYADELGQWMVWSEVDSNLGTGPTPADAIRAAVEKSNG